MQQKLNTLEGDQREYDLLLNHIYRALNSLLPNFRFFKTFSNENQLFSMCRFCSLCRGKRKKEKTGVFLVFSQFFCLFFMSHNTVLYFLSPEP